MTDSKEPKKPVDKSVNEKTSLIDEKMIDLKHNKLYHCLTEDRKSLGEYCEKYGSFEFMTKEIMEIEKKFPENAIIFKQLVLGNSDIYPDIYELPTQELIKIIFEIINFFKIKFVVSIFDPSGILNYLLGKFSGKSENNDRVSQSLLSPKDKKTGELKIVSYYSLHTSGHKVDPKYHFYSKMENAFINHIPMHISHQIENDMNSMVICYCPSDHTEMKQIYKLLDSGKISVVVILGENFGGSSLSELDQKKLQEYKNYNLKTVHGKQIATIDYFNFDKIRKPGECRTKTILLWKKDLCENIDKLLSLMKLGGLLANPSHEKLTTQYILQDYVANNIFPKFCLDLKEHEINTVFSIYFSTFNMPALFDKVTKSDKLTFNTLMIENGGIPSYIKDFKMLKYWHDSILHGIHPLNIKSVDQYYEYYDKITNLDYKGLKHYHDNNSLPKWIETVMNAKKYYYLLYSTDYPPPENIKQLTERVNFLEEKTDVCRNEVIREYGINSAMLAFDAFK